MAVTYNPFVSKSGFKSEGFEVDTSGNLTAAAITSQNLTATTFVANDILVNTLDAANINLNGKPLFGSDSTDLTVFEITTDFMVTEGSTPYISVMNGQISITNRFDTVGKIDNIEIGSTTPQAGTFTSITTGPIGIPEITSNTNLTLSAANAIVFRVNGVDKGRINDDGINVPVINTTISDSVINNTFINNTIIGNITPNTGAFTSINISNQPTLPSEATRKDYVDAQVSAFSIAFGI